MPASRIVLALRLIQLGRGCPGSCSRCSVHRVAGCVSLKTATFITACVCSVSLFVTEFRSACLIGQSSAPYSSILPVRKCLRDEFQRFPCVHTTAGPTLPSSDCGLSVDHIQTPTPTLACPSLAQRIASLLPAISSLSMSVLTAGSSSWFGQRMVAATRPRMCFFVLTLYLIASNVRWLCTAFGFEPLHALASLILNRCCRVSRATGVGVSPANLKSAPIGVMGRVPRVDLACR
jgi:hypothetical protein